MRGRMSKGEKRDNHGPVLKMVLRSSFPGFWVRTRRAKEGRKAAACDSPVGPGMICDLDFPVLKVLAHTSSVCSRSRSKNSIRNIPPWVSLNRSWVSVR